MAICWYILSISIILMLFINIVVKNQEAVIGCCIPIYIISGAAICIIIIIKILESAVNNWFLFIINVTAIIVLFIHTIFETDNIFEYFENYRYNFTAEHTKILITLDYLKNIYITNPQKWIIRQDEIEYDYKSIGFKNFWEYVKFTIWYKQYQNDKRIAENHKVELDIYQAWADDIAKFKDKVEEERVAAEKQALDTIEKILRK